MREIRTMQNRNNQEKNKKKPHQRRTFHLYVIVQTCWLNAVFSKIMCAGFSNFLICKLTIVSHVMYSRCSHKLLLTRWIWLLSLFGKPSSLIYTHKVTGCVQHMPKQPRPLTKESRGSHSGSSSSIWGLQRKIASGMRAGFCWNWHVWCETPTFDAKPWNPRGALLKMRARRILKYSASYDLYAGVPRHRQPWV